MKTNQKKIDIYLLYRFRKTYHYECSTTQSKTCKEAKARFLAVNPFLSSDQVKAVFSKQ